MLPPTGTSICCLTFFKDNEEKGILYQLRDIEKPFDYALAKGVKNVIVPGDLGQTEDLSSTAKFHFLNLLLKYDGLLNIYIIPGNHDFSQTGVHNLKLFELLSSKEKFKTIHFFTECTKLKIDKEKFHFVPYPFTRLLPGYVNVAHVEPANFKRDNGRPVKDGLEVAEEISLVNGHLHTYQSAPNKILVGTLYQCNFGEKGVKGFVHLKVRKGKMTHKHIPIKPSFTFSTIEISSADDWINIPKGETDFARVYVRASLTIPDEIHSYSNVLQISGKIQEAEDENGIVVDAASLSVIEEDEDELKDYLKNTFRYSKYQVKRTMQLRAKARAKVAVEKV